MPSIPIVALMIVFLTLVIGLSVEQKRNETAILRSRGTSPFQVIGLATIEGLILGVISLVIGTGFAILITKLMGSVRSFMNFTAISKAPSRPSWRASSRHATASSCRPTCSAPTATMCGAIS